MRKFGLLTQSHQESLRSGARMANAEEARFAPCKSRLQQQHWRVLSGYGGRGGGARASARLRATLAFQARGFCSTMAPKGGSKQQSEEDLLLQDFSRNLSAKSSALFFGNAFIVSAIPICECRELAGGAGRPRVGLGWDVAGPGVPARVSSGGARLALSPARLELGEARSLCGPQCSRLGQLWVARQESHLWRFLKVRSFPGPSLGDCDPLVLGWQLWMCI